MGPNWGINIGSTQVEAVLLDGLSRARPFRKMRVPLDPEQGYYYVLGQVHKLVEVLSADVGMRPDRIGVSTWGQLDPETKTLKNSGSQALDGKPLLSDLETYLGVPVRIENAANCLTLAETRFGVVTQIAPDARCILGLLIEDRVDGGIVLNGRIFSGRQGIAGSWGHNYLDAGGGTCDCGRHGCTQTVLSDQALEEFYATQGGRMAGVHDIMACAEDGQDDAASETLERYVYNLAKALGPVINILDPEVVVLGGTLSAMDAVYEQGPELLRRFVHNSRVDTKLVRPQLGHAASAYGAALL